MNNKFIYVIVIFIVAGGVAFAIKYRSEASALEESQQRFNAAEKILAQCVAAKASRSAKEAIAATFWGQRRLDQSGNMRAEPDPVNEERALQAINILANICIEEEQPNRRVTIHRSFNSAWRLAEMMTVDAEFSEAVDRAKEARRIQEEAESAKQQAAKNAEEAKASWAVK